MIVLRDMRESDIEDYVRWFTRDMEWMRTDATDCSSMSRNSAEELPRTPELQISAFEPDTILPADISVFGR